MDRLVCHHQPQQHLGQCISRCCSKVRRGARAALWAPRPVLLYSIGLVEAPFSVCEPQQLSLSQLVEATEPSADPRLFRTRAASSKCLVL